MKVPPEGIRTIAHCQGTVRKWLDDAYRTDLPITILIGPEGDFSNSEIKTAESNGYIPITLGNSRLRTETAGVVACHTISWLGRER
jgi:16S rRNA (uracil1498-N3)-methyltransferase